MPMAKLNKKGQKNFMGEVQVRFLRLNWDVCFHTDMVNGTGFQITQPADVSMDGTKERNMWGARSPLYGATYGSEQEYKQRFRCSCGLLTSRQFEGETCKICGTTVEDRGTDINTCGWISIPEPAHVIQPLYFRMLAQAIGKDFADIVIIRTKVDTNGNRSPVTVDDLDFVPSHPFYGMGLMEFYRRYEEVMTYFMNLPNKKNKRKTFERLINEKRAVFTQHIPVYSLLLRPQSLTQDTFYFQGADKYINVIFRMADSLRTCDPIEWDLTLGRIQYRLNKLWDFDFEAIHGKEGIIRDTILGGSLNYTARNVIVPDPTLKDNEVDLSYHTARELFKAKIIDYLQRSEDITLSRAEEIWNRSFIFDPKVYDIMQLILKYEDVGVVINRNPTLNFYSMLLMKIRRIKRSGADYCLSVPLGILDGLNADFDGDILNIIAIIDPIIKHIFRKFDPIKRMIIARDTGLLNPYFSVSKSQKIDLYHFATCGEMENDTPETYPEKGQELKRQSWEEPINVEHPTELKYFMDEEEQTVVKDEPELHTKKKGNKEE